MKIHYLNEIVFLNKKLDFPKEDYQSRPTVYGLVFDNIKNVAILHYKKFYRHPFPGGGVEKGESDQEAFIREIKEEIGCNIKDIELIGTFDSWSNTNKKYYPTSIFKSFLFGNKIKRTKSTDYELETEVKWLPLDQVLRELPNTNTSFLIKEIIRLSGLK